ncbi:ABC transporter ATP-binding protein [Pleionea sediminis]|uniref:ABC transporter ATP-binding protein n=1 Tax=Pleionea sediminis TaxID=2569479 RepID=UPI0013DDD44F|nr:ABC transporter ATP-binding protein [Pleionea sediminis]
MLLRATNVSKSYKLGENELRALNEVSIDIPQQSFIVIHGKSGSGKSTLLNVLSGIEPVSSGSLYFNDESFSTMSERKRTLLRRDHFGIIFQNFNLLPVFTALENVCYPLSLLGVGDARRQGMDALERVGLANFHNHRPAQLSGGQMQRVAIARAIVSKPDVIFADEPTANLDTQTSDTIVELLAELNAESKVTFVIATHHDDFNPYATERYEMADGKMKGMVSKEVEELMSTERIEKNSVLETTL